MKHQRIRVAALLLTCLLALVLSANTGSTLALVIDRTLSLVNTFVPAQASDGITLSIPVEKQYHSSSGQQLNPSGFMFELTEEGSGNSQYAVADETGCAAFSLSYQPQDAGQLFCYSLSEKNDHRPGVVYSETVYRIRIEVFSVDGLLTARMLVDGKDSEGFVATFENICTAAETPPTTGDPFAPVLHGVMVVTSMMLLTTLIIWRRRCDP